MIKRLNIFFAILICIALCGSGGSLNFYGWTPNGSAQWIQDSSIGGALVMPNSNTTGDGIILGLTAVPADILTASSQAPLFAFVSSNDAWQFERGSNNSASARFNFYKSRSVDGSGGTIVQNGDKLGEWLFWGANGTGFSTAASIIVTVNGVPGAANDMPGAIDFQLSPDNSSTLASAFKLTNDKLATFPGALSVGTIGIGSEITSAVGTTNYYSFLPNGNYQHIYLTGVNSAGNGTLSAYLKSRKTDGTGDTIVQNGDRINQNEYYGANGSGFSLAGYTQFIVDGVPGASNDMPGGYLWFLSPDGSATPAQVLKLGNDKAATFAGKITSTATADIGWSVVAGANTACNTTCTNACVFGVDTGSTTNSLLACTDATADLCLCAGAS